MATRIIELAEGIAVEVDVPPGQQFPRGGGISDRVDQSIDQVQDLLGKVLVPVVSMWKELNRDVAMAEAEVELGFTFSGEGNLYLTKVTGGTHLKVKLKLPSQTPTQRRRLRASN